MEFWSNDAFAAFGFVSSSKMWKKRQAIISYHEVVLRQIANVSSGDDVGCLCSGDDNRSLQMSLSFSWLTRGFACPPL
jgi:hypothetical protein